MQPEEIVNILLVHQDENSLLELENILSSLDRNLVKAHSWEEALQALPDRSFAVAVADARIPGIDGFETAAHPPVIFVIPAGGSQAHVAQDFPPGAVEYIYSPIMPEILRAKVPVFVELKLQR